MTITRAPFGSGLARVLGHLAASTTTLKKETCFLPLVGLAVLPAAVDGQAEGGDGLAARREPQLGVAGDVADQGDAVSVAMSLRSVRF